MSTRHDQDREPKKDQQVETKEDFQLKAKLGSPNPQPAPTAQTLRAEDQARRASHERLTENQAVKSHVLRDHGQNQIQPRSYNH